MRSRLVLLKNNFWYIDKNNFIETDSGGEEGLDELLRKTKESKEIYIRHFYTKYDMPEYPPSLIWDARRSRRSG